VCFFASFFFIQGEYNTTQRYVHEIRSLIRINSFMNVYTEITQGLIWEWKVNCNFFSLDLYTLRIEYGVTPSIFYDRFYDEIRSSALVYVTRTEVKYYFVEHYSCFLLI
jgi:hypothetical protein